MKPCYKKNRPKILLMSGSFNDELWGIRGHGMCLRWYDWRRWHGLLVLEGRMGAVFSLN